MDAAAEGSRVGQTPLKDDGIAFQVFGRPVGQPSRRTRALEGNAITRSSRRTGV